MFTSFAFIHTRIENNIQIAHSAQNSVLALVEYNLTILMLLNLWKCITIIQNLVATLKTEKTTEPLDISDDRSSMVTTLGFAGG